MKQKIYFNLKNGKYIAKDGSEITTEMLMNNEHYIKGINGCINLEIKNKIKAMKENKSFTTQGCPDEKYFTFDGKLDVNCPVCSAKLECDFNDDHIEYINDHIGSKDYKVSFCCDNCNKEFLLPVLIESVTYTVNLSFDKTKLYEYS